MVCRGRIFLVFNARLRLRFGERSCLQLRACAAIVRWIAYPMIEPLGLGVPGFFAVQTLHALSTRAPPHRAFQNMIFGGTVAEERTGAAQGLAFFSTGFCMAAVTLLSGPLYERLGSRRVLRDGGGCAGRAGVHSRRGAGQSEMTFSVTSC